MIHSILLQTVVSEFTNRFLQPERASVVTFVTLLSLLVALLLLPRLARMLQRGDGQFNSTIWRWGLGILFTFLFPSFLSTVILKTPVSEIILAAPTQPVLDQPGYVPDERKQHWITTGQQEKAGQTISPFAGYEHSLLGPTVINPMANPSEFGVDLWYPKP